MRKRTYSLIGAIALAWSGAGAASDAAKEDPPPLDPARVQAGGTGATGEGGISESQSGGAVKEGEEVRAGHDAESRGEQNSGADASEQKEGTTGMSQGDGGISSATRNP